MKEEQLSNISNYLKIKKRLKIVKKEFDLANTNYMQALERRATWKLEAEKDFIIKKDQLELLFLSKIKVIKERYECLKSLQVDSKNKEIQHLVISEYKNFFKKCDINKTLYF